MLIKVQIDPASFDPGVSFFSPAAADGFGSGEKAFDQGAAGHRLVGGVGSQLAVFWQTKSFGKRKEKDKHPLVGRAVLVLLFVFWFVF